MSDCWICGCRHARLFLPSTVDGPMRWVDVRISDSRYGRTARIVECLACGFRFADPLPATDLISLYQAMQDPEYEEEREGKLRSFRRTARQCKVLAPEARTFLDIGAGTGLMCLAAREAGFRVRGVEPSAWLVRRALVDSGIELLEGTFPHPQLFGLRFDIIALMDVIEHVPNPLALLRDVAHALNPGGLVVITTPNGRSLAARLLGRRWWHYRAAHVGYFDPRTMAGALHRAGLVLELRRPYPRFFSLEYLLKRVERYARVGWGRRALARSPAGRRLLRRMVRLSLGDSDTYYARLPARGMAKDRSQS